MRIVHEHRRTLRRWCRAAIVLAVVAATATVAGGVPAATRAGAVTVDRTVQCANLNHAIFHVRCAVPRMLFRIRLVNDSSGVPLRAQLRVVRLQGRRPLVCVSWTRERMTAFAAPACVAVQ